MAMQEREVRSPQLNRTDGRFDSNYTEDEVPLGDLLRRFGQDASTLIKQEIALAKVELRESVKGYVRDVSRLGIALGAAWFGAMALVAFLVIGLGDLINNYWVSALIVAVVFLGIAAALAKGALAHMKRNSLAPEETVETIKEDQHWAKQEAREFKQRIKA